MSRIILLIFFTLLSNLAFSQKSNFSAYGKQPVKLSFEKNCKGVKVINRKNKNEVTFMFFQIQSDTVSVYINGIKAMEKFIKHDSDLVSTDYSGIDFTNVYPDKVNTITICYHNERSCIEFLLNKKFPLYGIYNLAEKRFYVSGRKCQMVIK